MNKTVTGIFLILFLMGCIAVDGAAGPDAASLEPWASDESLEQATFAGGCFWCVEAPFEKLDGVAAAISGYTGGAEDQPTYKEVSAGKTGHTEAVRIYYDPRRVTYERLLDVFWRQIDPTDAGGQFVDRGSQYRTGIFYHDEQQKLLAERSRDALNRSGRYDKPIVTEIVAASKFFPAEAYHQDYYKTNTRHYQRYRYGSGRDQYLMKIWEDDMPSQPTQAPGRTRTRPSDEELRKRLTPLQYEVTQKDGTERPFDNAYWDNKKAGIYVDVVSGEVLFSSKDKYASGTGWPSFTRPLEPSNIKEDTDYKIGYARTEVRSAGADSHLGHLFPDGPEPTGQRYCINSAALRFIPREDLDKEGYGKYQALFED